MTYANVRLLRRRICWPEPDAVCLEGGCGYCRYQPLRSRSTIERWLVQQDPTRSDPRWVSWRRGLRNEFYHRVETRIPPP